MYNVSRKYSKQIKKVPFRNRSHIKAILGVINKEAQNNIKAENLDDYLYISNVYDLFETDEIGKRYATYERDYFRVDGSMLYAPKEEELDNYIISNNGIISKTGIINFSLGNTYDLPGLTIDFGYQIINDFNVIINDEDEVIEIRDNTESRYVIERGIESVSDIKIIIFDTDKMLHIEYFLCGVAIVFNNKNTEEANINEEISPVSLELSSTRFELTGFNNNRRFDIEKEENIANYLKIGMDIDISLGYELDSKKIEYVKMAKLSLSEWIIDDKRIIIKGEDTLSLLDERYIEGVYEEHTLYDLAEMVFVKAGIEDYYIDPLLKDFNTKNPLPPVSYKELLQLIANAGTCSLIQGRNGSFEIIPTIWYNEEIEKEILFNNEAEWSNGEEIIDDEIVKTSVGDMSKDYFIPDGSYNFNGSIHPGFISDAVADSNGDFETNPIISISFEKTYPLTAFIFDFVANYPSVIKVTTYNNDIVKDVIYFNVDDIEYDTGYNFGRIDKVIIEFIKGAPNSRVHISNLYLKPIDFVFNYECDLKESPKATLKKPVKDITLETNLFTKSDSITQVYTDDIEIIEETEYDNYLIYFNNISDVSEVYINDVRADEKVIKKSNYAMIIDLSAYAIVGEVVNVKINGYVYNEKIKKYHKVINEIGTEETYNNCLISNEEHARKVLHWLSIYESINKEYQLENRGYPELDCNDIVFLEIPTLDSNVPVRIVNQNITFSGGALRAETICIREVEAT